MNDNETHFCTMLTTDDLSEQDRQRLAGHKAALLSSSKWGTGDVITVRFLAGDPSLQQRVRKVAKEWTRIANLTLDFRVSGPTDIRIAFMEGRGSWCYLGTRCRQIPENEPTMNYGWLTANSSEDEVRRVVLHEFGHALGLIHEHRNPQGGVRWNRAAVVRDLYGPPYNLTYQTIEDIIFRNYERTEVTATDVDPTSIMIYPIPKAWTTDGFSAELNRELSAKDKQFISQTYAR